MKLLTKEEEAEHYSATVKGGTIGVLGGLVVGTAAVLGANRRFHFVQQLTLPLKAFLVTSSGTFAGIIAADHASRSYQASRNPLDVQYAERERTRIEAERGGMTFTERAMDWGRRERYKIVGGSWAASMIASWALVNRNKYLTGAQKLVQARVYAQFLTLGVLIATAAFEISDSKNEEGKLWETVKIIDPNDPEHKKLIERREPKETWQGENLWREMVDSEEQRLKQQDRMQHLAHKREERKAKSKSTGDSNGKGKKAAEEPSKNEKKRDDGEETDQEEEEEEEKKKKETKKDKKGKK